MKSHATLWIRTACLLVGLAAATTASGKAAVQVTPDGGVSVVHTEVDGARWAITYDRRSGSATGNVLHPDGRVDLLSCEESWSGIELVSFACSIASPPGKWTSVGEVALPLGFFGFDGSEPLQFAMRAAPRPSRVGEQDSVRTWDPGRTTLPIRWGPRDVAVEGPALEVIVVPPWRGTQSMLRITQLSFHDWGRPDALWEFDSGLILAPRDPDAPSSVVAWGRCRPLQCDLCESPPCACRMPPEPCTVHGDATISWGPPLEVSKVRLSLDDGSSASLYFDAAARAD